MSGPASDPALDTFTDDAGSLVFYHPVDDEPIDESFLPWGPVAAGSSADARVRVRNTSDGYIAQAVIVALAGPVDDAADASGQHLISADGAATFAATADLGDLRPQATSEPVVLRRVTPPDAEAGPAAFTLTASATAWLPAVAEGTTAAAAAAADAYDPQAAQSPVDDAEGQM